AAQERTNYPITVAVDDEGEGFALVAQVDRRIEAQRITVYLHTAMASLVQALEQAPHTDTRHLAVLPALELKQVLAQFNATEVSYPPGRLLPQLFEEQVRASPDAVAVVYEGERLSYGELNRRANQLAHYLRQQGVGPDRRVGLCVERSVAMVVGILGVLKAGGAYVPLDPSYPPERLGYLLSDATPQVLLTQGHLRE